MGAGLLPRVGLALLRRRDTRLRGGEALAQLLLRLGDLLAGRLRAGLGLRRAGVGLGGLLPRAARPASAFSALPSTSRTSPSSRSPSVPAVVTSWATSSPSRSTSWPNARTGTESTSLLRSTTASAGCWSSGPPAGSRSGAVMTSSPAASGQTP
ncbi:hypothetical protein [Actinomadura madurae]|uniref:hypothetical protein n=1 Tax=Actinomadura madurae TaxID=1993 RepID=UPI0020D24C98|nr:hypothetical protein [Actinomadura madurae]MCP9951527.1 hypothetical protein [Actinomadura madurae]MCP9968301.1 hypothetical protein [Actinomadura madurae]MCP9980765.1 hypothetical protein [Actinomadura madurae]